MVLNGAETRLEIEHFFDCIFYLCAMYFIRSAQAMNCWRADSQSGPATVLFGDF